MIEIIIWLAMLVVACAGLAAAVLIVGALVLVLRSWWCMFRDAWIEIGG